MQLAGSQDGAWVYTKRTRASKMEIALCKSLAG